LPRLDDLDAADQGESRRFGARGARQPIPLNLPGENGIVPEHSSSIASQRGGHAFEAPRAAGGRRYRRFCRARRLFTEMQTKPFQLRNPDNS
jgi:hypothetical protein